MNKNKNNLTPAKQQLLTLMQNLNFGTITGLVIRDGEPVLKPSPRVVREVKFCAENGPRPEAGKQDFALKAAVLDLFTWMEALGNGTILSLQIQRGLPFRMTIEEDAA